MKEMRNYMGGLGNRMFQYAFLHSQVREGKLPDIYLQDYKYFDKYKEELKSLFSEGIEKSDYISVHIRRGDYVNNPFYVDLWKTGYYSKAFVKLLYDENDNLITPHPKFLVFCSDRQEGSDDKTDIEWCKEKLSGLFSDYFEFFQGKDEIEDFNKMAGCKAHIMANSSFSFWASYIGGGRTIAPKEWFSNGTSIPLPSNFEII